MERHIFSVTEVNELVKLLLDNEPMLSGICVRGEISNYKMYPSGHHYFSLKDPTGAIRCVMFKGQALRLRFRPENGMKVLVTGRVSVFPRDGAYQLYCDTMTPEGAGDLALAFEQLKAQLYKEGLFDEAHKAAERDQAENSGTRCRQCRRGACPWSGFHIQQRSPLPPTARGRQSAPDATAPRNQ